MRGPDDRGVTAVLGAILMLAIMMPLIIVALIWAGAEEDAFAAKTDEAMAYADASRKAAWCARHPNVGPPECPEELPGWVCQSVRDALVCVESDALQYACEEYRDAFQCVRPDR